MQSASGSLASAEFRSHEWYHVWCYSQGDSAIWRLPADIHVQHILNSKVHKLVYCTNKHSKLWRHCKLCIGDALQAWLCTEIQLKVMVEDRTYALKKHGAWKCEQLSAPIVACLQCTCRRSHIAVHSASALPAAFPTTTQQHPGKLYALHVTTNDQTSPNDFCSRMWGEVTFMQSYMRARFSPK